MIVRRSPSDRRRADAPHYSAEKVRGAEIVLRTRAERVIFVTGLAGAVLLGLVLVLASG